VAQDVRFLDRAAPAAGPSQEGGGLETFGREADLPEDDLPF
jgi:hypothetical protein